jgi:hypothetical protein
LCEHELPEVIAPDSLFDACGVLNENVGASVVVLGRYPMLCGEI